MLRQRVNTVVSLTIIVFDVPTAADTDYIALCLIHNMLHQLVHLHDFYYSTSIRGNFICSHGSISFILTILKLN
jgi:hypothetical protein